jgi:hypothetical protein
MTTTFRPDDNSCTMRGRPKGAFLFSAVSCVLTIGLCACGDVTDPTTSTVLPPDATQPVNSMTQDSAMVPGGGLEPVREPEQP